MVLGSIGDVPGPTPGPGAITACIGDVSAGTRGVSATYPHPCATRYAEMGFLARCAHGGRLQSRIAPEQSVPVDLRHPPVLPASGLSAAHDSSGVAGLSSPGTRLLAAWPYSSCRGSGAEGPAVQRFQPIRRDRAWTPAGVPRASPIRGLRLSPVGRHGDVLQHGRSDGFTAVFTLPGSTAQEEGFRVHGLESPTATFGAGRPVWDAPPRPLGHWLVDDDPPLRVDTSRTDIGGPGCMPVVVVG